MLMRFLLLLALLCCSSAIEAQDWSPWRALGPFDHVLGTRDLDPLVEGLGSMEAGEPELDYGRRFVGKAGVVLTWKPLVGVLHSARGLDLGRMLLRGDLRYAPESLAVPDWADGVSTLLYRSVIGRAGQTLKLSLGADDGASVWWNAKRVLHKDEPSAFAMDMPLELELEEGRNHLLVAVSNQGGAWCFRMADASELGAPHGRARAIERGAQWLLDQQLVDGTWGHYPGYPGGVAAMAAYTLLHCGVKPEHPSVRRALDCAKQLEEGFTYSLSIEIMALCSLGKGGDEAYLRRRVKQLIELQDGSGLYGYPVYPDGGARPVDISLTIFAAIALRAASELGYAIPKPLWVKMLEGIESCKVKPSGPGSEPQYGFSYRIGVGAETGSMTAAAVAAIAVCEQALGSKMRKTNRRDAREMRLAGLRWMGANLEFKANPNKTDRQYYWLYGLERAAGLLGLERIGGVDWFRSGSNYLLGQQNADGSWYSNNGSFESTVFALLFLSRSNRPSSEPSKIFQKIWSQEGSQADVLLRGHGDTPLVLSLDAYSKSAKAMYTWPGEQGPRVLQVEYFAKRADGNAKPISLAKLRASGERGAPSYGFGLRESLPSNGAWELSARVTLLAPAHEAGIDASPVVLESAGLLIQVDGVLDPELLGYAPHRTRNTLGEASVQVSSQLGEAHAGQKLIDGQQGSAWLCAASDPRPVVVIDPEAQVKARKLVLSHRDPKAANRHQRLPHKLRITLNGVINKAFVLEMNPDPLRKTVLDFGKLRKIRRIEIEVLGDNHGELGKGALGFAELELLL